MGGFQEEEVLGVEEERGEGGVGVGEKGDVLVVWGEGRGGGGEEGKGVFF